MSPLNITQPLGIWSIMATIRWCPIYPKWDSYQPLIFILLGASRYLPQDYPPTIGDWAAEKPQKDGIWQFPMPSFWENTPTTWCMYVCMYVCGWFWVVQDCEPWNKYSHSKLYTYLKFHLPTQRVWFSMCSVVYLTFLGLRMYHFSSVGCSVCRLTPKDLNLCCFLTFL